MILDFVASGTFMCQIWCNGTTECIVVLCNQIVYRSVTYY